jgi:hypothetical protein
MVKGLLADADIIGSVESLVQQMQSTKWVEFWAFLGLEFKRFDDVGLSLDASDLVVWQTCQARQLVLITANRNKNSLDSLEATIRQHNQPDSLPVFTISSMNSFNTSRTYAEKVLEDLYDYIMRIDEIRGTGRLYLPQKQ